jgi:hypothetical protein
MKLPLIALCLLLVIVLGIGATTPWTGLGFVLIVVIMLGLGLAVMPRGAVSDTYRAGALVVLVATGLSIAILLWSVSLYAFKDAGLGTLLIIGIAAFGFRRQQRDLPTLTPSAPELAAISIALLIGFYITGINDLHFGDQIHFSFRYDWPAHGHFAAMVAELGLPQVGLTGSPDIPFNGLGHSGLSVLIAGTEQLTMTTIYQAMRIFALLSFPMITLGAYALLCSRVGNSWWRMALCLTPLFWSGLVLPVELVYNVFVFGDFYGVIDPYQRALYGGLVPAGTIYHNIPQGLSIAQGMALLVALDRWRQFGERWWFIVALTILGASMSVKPSLFIVMGPALLLTLALSRTRLSDLAIFGTAIIAAVIFYCLPTFMVDLPDGPGWSIAWHNLRSAETWLRLALFLGIALPFMVSRGLSAPRRLLKGEWQWVDITIIATMGAILFHLIMRENGREAHGNHGWPLAATIILLSPFIVGSIVNLPLIWRRIAVGILTIQLAGGILYAINYPLLFHRTVPTSIAETLKRCRASSTSHDRFLLDPTLALHWSSNIPYLRRANPCISVAITTENEQRQTWLQFSKGKAPAEGPVRDLVSGRTAVIIGPKTLALKPVLKDLEWQRAQIKIPEPYELWLRKP